MRAGLGLVGLLICVGVIVWIMHKSTLPYTQEVLKKNDEMRQTLNPIAGYSRDGTMKFSESLMVEAESKGGKIVAVDVTQVKPGGPADTDYGLKEGDAIMEIGALPVKDNVQTDADAMNQLVQFGYERSAPLVVMRDGNRITLNLTAGKAVAAKPAPAKPSNKPGDQIQQQIDMHAVPGMP